MSTITTNINIEKSKQLTDLHQVNGHQQLNISLTYICVRTQLVLSFSHTTNLLSGIVVVFFTANNLPGTTDGNVPAWPKVVLQSCVFRKVVSRGLLVNISQCSLGGPKPAPL